MVSNQMQPKAHQGDVDFFRHLHHVESFPLAEN